MNKLRVVHCGCGGIANAWFSTQARKEQIEIVGVVDLNVSAAERVRGKFELGDVPVGSDLAAMLKEVQPDAVFDTTVPAAHHTVTLTALEHGCHVLGEKPLADTTQRAAEMVAAAEKAGLLYGVTQTRRWNPNLHALRAFLESGAIGEAHTFFADFVIAADFGGFRAEMDHVLLLDMAIHSFDQARVLMGDASPEWVQASEWNPPDSRYRHGANAFAHFGFEGGKVFSYRGTWSANGRQTSWECDWNIQATQGGVTWRGEDGLVAQRRTDMQEASSRDGGPLIRSLEEVHVPELPDGEHFRRGHDGAIANFIDAVQKGSPLMCPCADNIKSLAMVEAAITSAKSGQREVVRW